MTHYKKMFPGKYLKGTDLVDGEMTLTIASIQPEEIEGSRQKTVIRFNDERRGFVCNVTNADIIAGLYGEDYEGWVGKRITLYFDPSVMMGREKRGGIKVRPVKPATGWSNTKPTEQSAKSPLQEALYNAVIAFVGGDIMGVEPTLMEFTGQPIVDRLTDDQCLEAITAVRKTMRARPTA